MKAYPASELLELSLGFEQNARELYLQWAVLFCTDPDVAEFWRRYSADEAFHASLLDNLRSRLTAEELASPIESDLVGDTRRLLSALQKEETITDLDEAYRYANMIEHSEINPLFEIVLAHFEKDPAALELLRSQLEAHIDKLIYNFPKRYSSSEMRREFKV
jgi:rubrerythrin